MFQALIALALLLQMGSDKIGHLVCEWVLCWVQWTVWMTVWLGWPACSPASPLSLLPPVCSDTLRHRVWRGSRTQKSPSAESAVSPPAEIIVW